LGIDLNSDSDGYKRTSPAGRRHFGADEIQKKDIATCLLTGVVTDTVGFRTANVTPRVMQAVMRLMNAGASLAHVMYFAFNQRPLVELSVLRLGLNHLQVEDGLAWSEIGLDERHAVGYEEDGDAGLAGTLVRTKEINISAVFTEKENNEVEISFRADPGFDVAQLALQLGGGGHPAASGCTLAGSLEAAKARVLPMLREVLRQQQKTGNPK
jgi:phosphoesterase RecJ-like protein